jgi:polysaccharide biosynthesis transport protein
MMEESLAPQERASSESSSHIVHAMMQFAMAIKHRKNVVILCVFVTLALGAFYYSTATRLYSARAELVILASGDDVRSTGISGQGRNGKNLMQTFERMITSSNVIEAAIERLGPKERIDLAEVPKSKWVTAIQRNLSAKSIYGTNNIEIEYLSRDPAAAVAVVNQVVDAYHEFLDSIHKRTSDELINRVKAQQAEISEELESLHRQLEQKRAECGHFVGADAEAEIQHPDVERFFNVKQERSERENERYLIEAKLGSLQDAVREGGDLQPHIMAVQETVGRDLLTAAIGLNAQDKAKLAELDHQRVKDIGEINALQFHYGERHPKVQNLRSKVQAAEQALDQSYELNRQRMNAMRNPDLARMLIGLMRQQIDELARYEERLAIEEQELLRKVTSISGQLIRISVIEREIEVDNQISDRHITQLANLSGAEDGPIVRTQLVSDPVQATSPASPSLRRTAMLALLAGLAMGLAAVYVLDTLDDRFRSVEELQAQVGVPVMAIVQNLPDRHLTGVEALQLVAEPDAAESEAFRTLRTSLALTHDQSRRIVVTSAEPGDGKSTVLANVAVAYASSGKRTLLIDADLRRPGLTNMLGIRGAEGLSTVMRAQQPIGQVVEGCVRPTGVTRLDVLPSGPRPMNPTELLGSQHFADLLAWAEGRYDCILIDSPPALAASDTAVIGQLVDGVLMVVQPHKNQRRMVLRAAETFAMLKIPLIGLVANRVGELGGSGYYGYAVDYSPEVQQDLDYFDYGDEVDCPPEPTSQGGTQRPGHDGGIDLSQLGGPRRRDAA